MKYLVFMYKEKDEHGNLDIVEYYTGKDYHKYGEKFANFSSNVGEARHYNSLMVAEKVIYRLHKQVINADILELGIEEI